MEGMIDGGPGEFAEDKNGGGKLRATRTKADEGFIIPVIRAWSKAAFAQ
jgi:hypothetical protein